VAYVSPTRHIGGCLIWAACVVCLSPVATAEPPAPQEDRSDANSQSLTGKTKGGEGASQPAPASLPKSVPPAESDKASDEPAMALKVALKASVEKNDLATGSFLCGLAFDRAGQKVLSMPPAVANTCADIWLRVGDKSAVKGEVAKAHDAWSRALLYRPGLKEDFLFVSRLKAHPVPEPTVKLPTEDKGVAVLPKPGKKVKARPEVVEPLGPRGGKIFGLGLGGGFDGLVSVVASFVYRERLAVEVSVGLLFPTIDTRVRYFGMKSALTPVVGFGMTTPLSSDARFELDVPGYTALYRLGQTVHVDVGLSWLVWEMDLFAGMVFITSLDQEHLDRLLFFPQFGLQAQFLF
jgi:hypothetical protein